MAGQDAQKLAGLLVASILATTALLPVARLSNLPNSPAERSGSDKTGIRSDVQIRHRDERHPLTIALPGGASISGDIYAEVSAGQKSVGVGRVVLDHVNG